MSPQTIALKDPARLYLDREHAHWATQDVDLSRDPADWAQLEPEQRDLLYFALSSLMVAEERISTQFCGLVLAQEDEEEGSYLSTQLVDEVRHMQFYARFQNAVIQFVEGYGLIAADEQRHIAYGTWFLREAVAQEPGMADVIREQIRELLPAVAESISPPREGAWNVLGVEEGALAEFALSALSRRLALIGSPLDG